MAVDYWPEQDGVIVKGLICGFCYCDAAVAANRIVKWGTGGTVGRVPVTPSTVVGDGIGVTLKEGAVGDIIPVVFSGIVKMTTSETLSIGNMVINSGSLSVVGVGASTKLYINSATQTILGCIMQTGADDNGDEVLVLLGGDGLSFGNV